MSIFAIDIFTGREYLLTGGFGSGSTTISGSTYQQYNLYTDFPDPSTNSNKIVVARSGDNLFGYDGKPSGFYFSNGSSYKLLGDTNLYFKSSNFKVYDSSNHDKGLRFVTSGITGNKFINLKIQDTDGTLAYLSDVNLKLDVSTFNTFTGTTLPNNYYNKSQINHYTGDTNNLINTKLNTSIFNTFTGTTLPDNYYNKQQINVYTGNTQAIVNNVRKYIGNGITRGFVISIHTGSTTIDISEGIGYIVDNYTNPDIPVVYFVDFTGKTNISLTYLNTSIITYIAIDKHKNVIQQTTQYTEAQRREYLLIGAAIHSNKTTINAINNLPDVILGSHNQYNDLLDSLKNFNKEGNVFSANGANLSINKSVGKIFKRGVNFSNDNKNPHVKTLPSLVAPSNIRYRLSDSTEYPDTNVVSLYYESSPGVRTALNNNDYTIQRIFLFSSNLIRIQYGTAVYNSMALAKQAITSESFTVEQNMGENGLLRCFLILKGNAIDLSNTTQASFIEVDKFGTMPLGGSGGITTLQQAYDNSTIPQIITNSALDGVRIKRGSASDNDKILEIQNGAGSGVTSINGNGLITTKQLIVGNLSGYTQFESDGTMVAKGDAITWRDEFPGGQWILGSGGAAPDIVNYTIGGVPTRKYTFDGGVTTESMSNTFEMPHDVAYDQVNADTEHIEVHVHWRPTTNNAGSVIFNFQWSYSDTNTGTAPVTGRTLTASGYTETNKQYCHYITSFKYNNISYLPKPTGLDFSLGDLVDFLFSRNPNNDTYPDDVIVEQVALHVPCDTLGSRQRYIK